MDQSLLFRRLNDVAASFVLSSGSLLFRAGDPAEGLYLVRSGRVNLHWGADSQIFLRESVGSGEIVGLPAALNRLYDATAILAEDSHLGYVSLSALHELEDECPAIRRALTELLAYHVVRRRSAFRLRNFRFLDAAPGMQLSPQSAALD